MAYTNIDDPSAHFQTLLWTGNSSDGRALTNDGNSDLQPDWVWLKNRNAGYNHFLQDSSRGNTKVLNSDSTAAESTYTNMVESFDTNGFTVGFDGGQVPNFNGNTFVAWQWKVNGGTTTSLTSNINSVCQVNQDAGISIVKYTCTGGGNGQAVQHGLGLVPQVIITKNRTDTSYSDWITYHHILTKDNFVKLNSNAASATNSPYNGAAPTSSTYNVSIDLVEATKDYVSYVFAPIQGYSKFGSYVGNGNANGPFVYTGFKPAFLIIKDTGAAGNWFITDHKRNPFNLTDDWLVANGSGAETNYLNASSVDYLSNGFKLRTSYSETNTSGRTYIYMAFAENPFVTSTGVPATAR